MALQHVIVAVGSTKAGARAQAAMQMMQAAGFIEHVDDKDRQAALMVVNQVESKKVSVAKFAGVKCPYILHEEGVLALVCT